MENIVDFVGYSEVSKITPGLGSQGKYFGSISNSEI